MHFLHIETIIGTVCDLNNMILERIIIQQLYEYKVNIMKYCKNSKNHSLEEDVQARSARRNNSGMQC